MKMLKAFVLSAGLMTATGAYAESADYVLNTASTGGTYHPVGTAISTLSKIKLLPKENFSLTAVNSAGSAANVQALSAGTADFAILQGLYGSYAVTGTGPISEPQANLRSVTMLWQNVEQFVVPVEKASTGTVSDLKALTGMPVGMGKENSGTMGSNKVLLSGLGLELEDFTLVSAGYGPTADALANGQAVAAGIPSGPPTGAITKLMASNEGKFTILDVTDEEAAAMDGGRSLWVPYTIAAGTYPGQEKDVNTIAQPNFLAVNASVDEEHVYLLTKTMFENLPFLQSIHPATKAMALEKAMAGLPAPLHPGAARYYSEMGLDIPEHLIAQ
ncbi:TAXI family TRAP transporter solute-binding subunit [uncultured Tateyamaria sp.]|uniref:TAXI family TRAP transporter solute-binding subunit n=1 Tax=uncultured Tateyamaria sp. TaxID=455651 RepID=UPI002634F9E7|nr:TAXI family TRAP transporter solute-binding subunit [uncultured Tateyamaria sp.]